MSPKASERSRAGSVETVDSQLFAGMSLGQGSILLKVPVASLSGASAGLSRCLVMVFFSENQEGGKRASNFLPNLRLAPST